MRPGWIEQRYRDDAQFSPEALWENLGVIAAFTAHGHCALLNIFPASMVVSPPLMNEDHFREQRPKENIRALAVVTDSEEMRTASRLYSCTTGSLLTPAFSTMSVTRGDGYWNAIASDPHVYLRFGRCLRSHAFISSMKELKEFWKGYSRYFVDVWQYLIIIVIFIIAALFVL